jgi:hypothetical protein
LEAATETANHFQIICGLLERDGKSCDGIASDPSAGNYGELSSCDAETKLSYLYSLYAGTKRDRCDFGGTAEWVNGNVIGSSDQCKLYRDAFASSSRTDISVWYIVTVLFGSIVPLLIQ